jgi:hypothetical protein
MFNHGYAVLFLADCVDHLTDPEEKRQVMTVLERAVKVIIDAQSHEGGWRYQPTPRDADITLTACQVEALCAAQNVGIAVPKKTLWQATDYVRRCQNIKNDGGFRYQPIGGSSGFARTAAGLTALNRLGVNDAEVFDKGLAYLAKSDVRNWDISVDIHFAFSRYYLTKAMWYAGDKEFQAWYPGIRDELLESQKDERWMRKFGCPHYFTATALIILQVPHGRLASMKRGN